MQAQLKASPKTSKLPPYKRQEKSYTERYKTISKLRETRNGSSSLPSDSIFIDEEISHRGEKIIDFLQHGGDISNIKIQEEMSESQIMKNQYLETELMWFKKIDQTKREINQIKEKCHSEQRIIKEMEKQLTNKKIKRMQMEEKIEQSNRANKAVGQISYEQETRTLQQQFDGIAREIDMELALLTEQKNQEQLKNQQLDEDIRRLEQQIQTLAEYQTSSYNSRLSSFLEEEDKLRQETDNIKIQIDLDYPNKIKGLQKLRPIKEQVHRKYLELYEKMFVNKQLDILQQLMQLKEQQIVRLEEYQRNKLAFKQKKMNIDKKMKALSNRQKTVDQLTDQIRQKSTILLNLYQYDNQKIK